MKKPQIATLTLFALLLAMSLLLMSCSSNNDDESDGVIFNQTSYRAQVNFIGIEILNVNAGQLLAYDNLDEDTTYLFQVTLFDSAGNVVQVIDSSIYVDNDDENQEINNTDCRWFISITEENGTFRVLSAS